VRRKKGELGEKFVSCINSWRLLREDKASKRGRNGNWIGKGLRDAFFSVSKGCRGGVAA